MSTDRYTSRSGERRLKSPKPPEDARFKGKEDYRFSAVSFPTPAEGQQRMWLETNYTLVQ